MSLNIRLLIASLGIFAISLVASVILISGFWADYVRASRSVELLNVFKRVLVAASQMSTERGWTSSILGEDRSSDPLRLRHLAQARAETDAALERLVQPDDGPGEAFADATVTRAVIEVREQLVKARLMGDVVASLPASGRSTDQVAATMAEMFEAADRLQPAKAAMLAWLVANDEDLTGTAMVAQMLGDLREYTGRLLSHAMPFIAAGRPLPSTTADAIVRTRERIDQLWQFCHQLSGVLAFDPKLRLVSDDIDARYFRIALALYDATIARGGVNGDYGIATAALVEHYVPPLTLLDQFRSDFVQSSLNRLTRQCRHALVWLVSMCIVAGLVVLGSLLFMWLVRTLVLRPLLVASETVISLAEGRVIDEVSSPTKSREMRHLFGAIEGLRLILRERFEYTRQLKNLSETDGLTGLMNRRWFDRFGEGDPELGGSHQEVALILMDVDRFKLINDTYGHQAGDSVLKRVGELVREITRASDLTARFGGEEIAIVITEQARSAAEMVAERIRAQLDTHGIVLDNGRRLQVTASFGIAFGQRGEKTWPAVLNAADRALYRAKSGGRNQVCVDPSVATDSSLTSSRLR